jgi:hypothetical protein
MWLVSLFVLDTGTYISKDLNMVRTCCVTIGFCVQNFCLGNNKNLESFKPCNDISDTESFITSLSHSTKGDARPTLACGNLILLFQKTPWGSHPGVATCRILTLVTYLIRIPVQARFSVPVQTGPGAHPAPCTMGTGSFLGVKSGRGLTLNPHPLLVL